MLKNSTYMIFLISLFMSTLITISANSWFSAWMGLEMNLMSFIPLMMFKNKNNEAEGAMTYFLIQSFASSLFLFMIILMMIDINYSNINQDSIINKMILSTLFLKSGCAPFQFWFPEVMESMSWMNNLILMTWQKISPMILMSYLIQYNLFLVSALLSIFMGAINGLNQISLHKMMAFSSINHLGWLMISLMISENIWMIYMLIYSFTTVTMTIIFNNYNMHMFYNMFSNFSSNKKIKMFLCLNLLSLGGFPPFLGFLPKWIMIQSIILNNQMTMAFIMMMLNLISMYFYLRLTFSTYTLNFSTIKFMNKTSIKKTTYNTSLIMTFFSATGLIFIMMIYSIF